MIQSQNFIRNSAKQFYPVGLLPGLPKINYKILRQMLYNYHNLIVNTNTCTTSTSQVKIY